MDVDKAKDLLITLGARLQRFDRLHPEHRVQVHYIDYANRDDAGQWGRHYHGDYVSRETEQDIRRGLPPPRFRVVSITLTAVSPTPARPPASR